MSYCLASYMLLLPYHYSLPYTLASFVLCPYAL